MKKTVLALTVVIATLWAGMASAHMFWINLNESRNHEPAHLMAALGFGHALPLDDFLAGTHGVIQLEKYEIAAPDMRKEDLGLPETTKFPTRQSPLKLNVTKGDLGLRKIGLGKDMQPGTYQIAAESIPMFITQYKDTKGKMRMAPKPLDAIKDLKHPIASFKYESFAKSYFAINKWSTPKPMGHELEITPRTDMSEVRVGDLVEFDVTFRGKPVQSDNKNIRYLSCSSNTFGGPDGFSLSTPVINGKGRFRMPTSGQWVANIYYSENVAENPGLADLKDKCFMVYTAASLFFTVKP